MTATAWHAPEDLLTDFARDPRRLDHVTAASVETHLAACADCRATVTRASDASFARMSWDAIADVVDRPRRSRIERLLAAVLPDDTARLVAATPSLQAAWLAAVIIVTAAAIAATHSLNSDAAFLALAPLLPLAGVAGAFGSTPDPVGETALATPAHGAGLVVARTLAVLTVTMPVLLVASAFLPVVDSRAVAWLLPALGLTALATALSTWWTPYSATTTAALAWGCAVLIVPRLDGTASAIQRSELFGAYGQVVFAVVLVGAGIVAATRRDYFSTLEAR